MNDHLLKNYLATVTKEMEDDYNSILSKVAEDPGTAGDQGERNWCELFRLWLPPNFQLETKGRIIGQNGHTSPQVDLLVLRPEYPKKLLDKKYYLASGVVAAFECKITLKSSHFQKFFKNAFLISKLARNYPDNLYRDLHSPIIYGLLAHSHEWKKPNSTPFDNFKNLLLKSDGDHITHPREMPGVICVADLLTSVSSKGINPGNFGGEESIVTTYFTCPSSEQTKIEGTTPIGTLLTNLLYKLAWEYKNIRSMADYFRESGVGDIGSGKVRFWNKDILSPEILQGIQDRKLSNKLWDEWCLGFT